MMSSLTLRRMASSGILSRRFGARSGVAQLSSSRLLNTNAIREHEDGDRDFEVERYQGRRALSPFSELFSPFSSRSSLSQILNMMDRFMDSPVSSSLRRTWHAKETADGLHLRLDMPGLGKEDVKVSVEQSTLIIKGESKKDLDGDESGHRYSSRLDVPERLYKTSDVKAEMKNGVLKIFLPKIKEEERNDVISVSVE